MTAVSTASAWPMLLQFSESLCRQSVEFLDEGRHKTTLGRVF